LPAGSASLVEVLEPNVLLLAAKQAEAAPALVLRLWEAGGRAVTAHVRLSQWPVARAVACNLVEEPQGPLEVKDRVISVPIRGSGLATVMVQ
jgi:alpha-mannosidase